MTDRVPTFVSTWEEAELNAARWVRSWGWSDARVTKTGPDGGIDVFGRGVVCQVKFRASQTGAPAVRDLYAASYLRHGSELIFFTSSTYSGKAVEFASEVNMALFTFDALGDVTPVNRRAEGVMRGSVPVAEVSDEDEDGNEDGNEVSEADVAALISRLNASSVRTQILLDESASVQSLERNATGLELLQVPVLMTLSVLAWVGGLGLGGTLSEAIPALGPLVMFTGFALGWYLWRRASRITKRWAKSS